MRVLILLSNNPDEGFLVKLHTEELIREMKKHLARRNNSKAMVTALTKGKIEREVSNDEVHTVAAELTLTRDKALWDITG